MKKVIILLALFCFVLFRMDSMSAKTFDLKIITDPEKSWTISFNEEVNNLADLNSIYVKAPDGNKHEASITISDDSKRIIVKPRKPYIFGTQYTLLIPKGFESAKGKKLKEDVTMEFKLHGLYIQNIQATANPFATHVLVQGTSAISKVTLSINDGAEEATIRGINSQFSRGMIGVVSGDSLTIRAYDAQGNLLEKQNYEVK